MTFSRELEVPAIPPAADEANTTYVRRTKAKAKHQGRQQLKSKWESNALHGKYPQRMKQVKAGVDQDKTHRWLKAADLKAETEGFIIEAQDQSLPTRWYQHNRWVMGVLGTIKKDMENYSNSIPDNINIHELQKITLLSTAHLLRRVLSIK